VKRGRGGGGERGGEERRETNGGERRSGGGGVGGWDVWGAERKRMMGGRDEREEG